MKALKAFSYSHDGFTVKALQIGDDASDVPADAVAGLMAEDYIGEDNKMDTRPVETGAAEPIDAYPHLSPAQEAALDGDGNGKPGGRKKKAG